MKIKLMVICLLLVALLAFATFFAALLPKKESEPSAMDTDSVGAVTMDPDWMFGEIHFAGESSGTSSADTVDMSVETEEPETEEPETEEPETDPANDGVLTLADGEILYGVRMDNSGANGAAFVLDCSELKANTNYKVSWSVDSSFDDFGFYFQKDGIYYAVSYTTSASELYQSHYTFLATSSDTYKGSISFTTTDEGYFEFLLFKTDDSTYEAANARFEDFISLINYFEIEEVA